VLERSHKALTASPQATQPIHAPRFPDRLDIERNSVWKGNDLIFRRRVVASIEPDSKYPNMWRVRLPNGHVTDMVNRSRAKDAAVGLAVIEFAKLKDRDSLAGAPPMRPNREAAE
jgi:hypothetical protein